MKHMLLEGIRKTGLLLCVILIFSPVIPPASVQAEPRRVEKEVLPNLFMDFSEPVAASGAGEIIVETLKPDPRKAEAMFIRAEKCVNRIVDESPSWLFGTSYYAEYEDEVSLSTDNMTICYTTPFSQCVSQAESLWHILNEETRLAEDLTFASREDAQANVLRVIGELGIENARCASVYALSSERMQQVTDEACNNEYYKDAIAEGRIPVKRLWSQEDECYWLRYDLVFSGIPVYPYLYEVRGDNEWLSGSRIDVLLTKNGIVGFEGRDLIRFSSEEPPQTLLSFEQATQSLVSKYGNVILEDPITLDYAALNYVARPFSKDAGLLRLIPAWCFRSSSPLSDERSLLDARDGRVLW